HGSRTRQPGTERRVGVNLPLLRSCPGFRDRASLRSDRRGRHWGRRRLVVFVADARRRDHDRRGIRTVRGDGAFLRLTHCSLAEYGSLKKSAGLHTCAFAWASVLTHEIERETISMISATQRCARGTCGYARWM